MTDRSGMIFGNPISERDRRKAERSKQKFMKRFGDDSSADYPVIIRPNPVIGPLLGVSDIRVAEEGPSEEFDLEKGLIVGNIRMGFGHYRISMAMASEEVAVSVVSKVVSALREVSSRSRVTSTS